MGFSEILAIRLTLCTISTLAMPVPPGVDVWFTMEDIVDKDDSITDSEISTVLFKALNVWKDKI
jgi:hypothetical protein